MKKYLQKTFPTYGETNVFWFYIISLFSSSWFQVGNWLLYVMLYMPARQFSYYEAIAFGLGILLEVPSGAFADLLGKRRTIILSSWMVSIGSGLFTLGHFGNEFFFIGNLLIIASFAFKSGSLEALVYDTLVEKKKTQHYDDIAGKGRSIHPFAITVAALIGGLLWNYSVFLPWITTTLFFSISIFASYKLVEPKVDSEKYSFKNFIHQNSVGFHYLFISPLRWFTFSFAAILGSYVMWHAGIIRVLMGSDFGFEGDSLSYLIAVTMLAGALSVYSFAMLRKKWGDRIGFSVILLMGAFAWLLSAMFSNNIWVGIPVFLLITLSGQISETWTSVLLNEHVQSKHRATAISTLSLFVQIPYVITVVIFSGLVEDGIAYIFYGVIAALLGVATIIYWIAEGRNKGKIIV